MEKTTTHFKPYISAMDKMPEFTFKAIFMGAIFGIIFEPPMFFSHSMQGLPSALPFR